MRQFIDIIQEVSTRKPLTAKEFSFWNRWPESKNYLRDQDQLKVVGEVNGIDIMSKSDIGAGTLYFNKDGEIVGYATLNHLGGFDAKHVVMGIIYLDAKFRRKGFGMGLYVMILNQGFSVISDFEHTPASRAVWNSLCKRFDVRVLENDYKAPKIVGDRLANIDDAYNEEGDIEIRLIASV